MLQSRTALLCCWLAISFSTIAHADPGPVIAEQPANGQRPASSQQTRAPAPSKASAYRFEVLASGLIRPWGMTFLPDHRILLTERPGRMRIMQTNGQDVAEVAGVPEVRSGGTAGLLDVTLDPDFAHNQLVYFTYLEGQSDVSGIAVGRASLDLDGAPTLRDVTVIFRAEPRVRGNENVGSRLIFGHDGMLYVTLGDRLEEPEAAQDLGSDLGKLIRITRDGSIPKDNPFVHTQGARGEIFALGQRNAEGLALEPQTGAIWESENGAKGGDELNSIKSGANYGWPVITYGRGYDDKPIGIGTAKLGMEQPIYYWDPSIAPSGLTFYNGNLFPDWKGNILLASMKGQRLARLVLENGQVVTEEELLGELHARLRTVAEGPDGALYVLTDEDQGRLIRVLPSELLSQNQADDAIDR